MSKPWLWKSLMAIAVLLVPGSLLLLPLVVLVARRRRASRRPELAPTPAPEGWATDGVPLSV